jgi:hypothetical protein
MHTDEATTVFATHSPLPSRARLGRWSPSSDRPRAAAAPAALDFTASVHPLPTHELGTSAADRLLPAAVLDGAASVGAAAHPRLRPGLPATVAPVSVPLSTGTGAAVALNRG